MDLSKDDLQKPSAEPDFNDWKDSVPVSLLSDALKITGKEHGMRLVADGDGEPVLSINPGLRAEDFGTRRWCIVEQVAELFLNATNDLKILIAAGKITLPKSNGSSKKSTGPSTA